MARPPTPQAPGAKPEEQLRIVADPSTNSLIIYGTAQEFQNVKNILKELDIVPRQVLIEALVLQVDLTNTETFGVAYEILRKAITTDAADNKTGGASIFDQIFGSRAAVLGTKVPSTFGLGVSGIIGTGNAVRAFVNTLLTDSRVRVLSAPSVLATDNRPARIQVGTEEPIPTGTINAATGTNNISSSTTVQYRNTGRILTIIPQVNSQGLVNLQVKAEVSARGQNVSFGSGDSTFPSFDTQDAETTAVVQDGETLVIGGLIGERRSRDRTGIPYLMDLPVVGRFFGSTTDDAKRTELIMLITPRVIRNRDESRSVTEDFKNKLSTIRNELERIRRDQERDLEKLKSQTREQPTPALPMPPAVEPQPPPVTDPARPGTYFGPLNPPVAPAARLIESSVGRDDLPPPPAQTQGGPEPVLAALESAVDTARSEKPVGAAAAAGGSTERLDMATAAIARTNDATPPVVKITRVWVVQVGSYAQAKEADLVAKRLRDKGYDVRVIVADVGGKTWHRVQVGEFASQQEAVDLQKSLRSSEKLEQTFVASR
ncbi:MAG: SPOR domain-containing protein [Deltaproteobacteria bacterium]|nr:SPOR domain-containing protein [Deltaproteobacteria bacterium]